jgi:hypothetical protein
MDSAIRITKEEHAAAVATPEGMGLLFSRMFALLITAFWKGAFPVLENILLEVVPNTMTLSEFLNAHPELSESKEFASAMQDIKRADPNVPMRELLQRAMEQMNMEAADGQKLG